MPTGEKQTIKAEQLLLISAISLLCIGLLTVSSASMVIAEEKFGNTFHFVIRHGISIFIAICCSVLAYQVPMRLWERFSSMLFFFAVLILTLVLLVGNTVNGSTRWVSLGFMNFQPSEAAKIFVLIYMASFIVRKTEEVQSQISGILKPTAILFLPAILLLLEPDFGSVVVLSIATFAMLFMGGVKVRYFALLILIGALLFYVLLVTQPYRVARLSGFLRPWENQFGSAYQLVQSLIAYGRGEWFGQGYGNSVQKLFYLPEAHTDFLIAVLAEEWGLLGVMMVVFLFSVLVLAALFISRSAEQRHAYFSAYLGYGLAVLMGIQVIFNLGVTMGLLPTKGLTLPLMSYGGSSLLSTCFLLAILLRIGKENKVASAKCIAKGARRNLKSGLKSARLGKQPRLAA